jgi:hypothetical protein
MRFRFWLYPPFGWIAYLPVAAVYAGLLEVILGAGEGLGAPSLVWHDLPATQLWAGFAVTALVAQLGAVGYLIDSRENPDGSVAPNHATLGSVARYLVRPLAVLLVAVVWGALGRERTRLHGALVVISPAVALAIVTWLAGDRRGAVDVIALIPRRIRARVQSSVERLLRRLPRAPEHKEPDREAHTVQFVLTVLVAVIYLLAWPFQRYVPAALTISFALSLFTGFWGFLRFWFRRARLLVAVVVLFFLGVAGRDRAVTGLAHLRFPNGAARPRPLLDDGHALEAWRRANADVAKPPLVVVTTSGGALRSAVWTINVLGRLEGRLPGFLRRVRLVTGASGGMVGAAHLVSALAVRGPAAGSPDAAWFTDVIEDAARDSLTPIAHALIFPFEDRGRALERSWEWHTKGRLAMPFRDLMPGEEAGWLPSLVYSPMLVEDGRRLLVSNLELDALTASFPTTPSAPSVSGVQLFACDGDGLDALKLSTVARLNATFPWVTSAARLTTAPDRRVVDAGYYDDYGVDLATAWLRRNYVWLRANTSGVLLLQLRDGATDEADPRARPGSTFLHQVVSGVTTPIEAFLNARTASMLFRNEEKVEALTDDLSPDPASPMAARFFATVAVEYPGEAPLEWYLDRASIEDLKQPPPAAPLDTIAAWWQARR